MDARAIYFAETKRETNIYLDTWRVKAHVVHPPAGRVDPAMTQSFLQRLQRNVKTNDNIKLAGTVQSLGLS